jgi:pimeloyl-ACP methyl ester carboxylesterase
MLDTSEHRRRDREIRLADGRRTLVRVLGDDRGFPVVCLHGTPGSRLKFDAAHAAALEMGVSLIAPDRWGYGGTDAPGVPRLEAYAADIAEIADALGVGRLALMGVSGGGPFAAVAAGVLGGRVTRLGLVGPVGPLGGGGAGLAGPFHQFSFRVLPRVSGAIGLGFRAYRMLLRWAPDMAVRAAVSRAPPADREIMQDPAERAALARAFAAGLENGVRGAEIDMELFSRSWRASALPPGAARVWLGLRDGNIPLGAARKLVQQLGASVEEIGDGGHFWIARRYPEILGWLAGKRA